MEHGDEELSKLRHGAWPYLHLSGKRLDQPSEPSACEAAMQHHELRPSERSGSLDAPDGDDYLASVRTEVEVLDQ